jgi:hypothetical protein
MILVAVLNSYLGLPSGRVSIEQKRLINSKVFLSLPSSTNASKRNTTLIRKPRTEL